MNGGRIGPIGRGQFCIPTIICRTYVRVAFFRRASAENGVGGGGDADSGAELEPSAPPDDGEGDEDDGGGDADNGATKEAEDEGIHEGTAQRL